MAVTGAIFNSLSFGGVNSADYGIYITGEAVFNAPKRAVEMVSVPGRNGSVAIDQGHWENLEVTYPAGTFGMDESEFATALSDFRNAIVSQIGYQRLTDTYHPDEYRMALYAEGLEAEPTTYNKAGEFELKFNCKPQRWLTSGETPETIGEWGATKTASGEIVTIESEGGEAAKSLVVSLEPIQAGSGEPSPDNVRPISGRTEVKTIVSPTTSETDGRTYTTNLGRTVYGGTLDVVSGVLTVDRAMVTIDGTEQYWYVVDSHNKIYNVVFTDMTLKGAHQSTDIDTNMGFTPTGYSYSVLDNTNYGICVRANETAQWRIYVKTENTTLANLKTWLASNPLQVVYPLATPQTYQLTPQQIELLVGENHVFSDGSITMQYGDDPNSLYNPTPYDAGPLLAVKGYGTIGFNGYTVELNNEVVGELELVEGQSDTGSVNETYASGLMDSGDTITLVNPTLAFRASSKYSGAQAQTIKNISVSGASDVTTSEVVVSDQRRIMNITFNGVTFSAHQAGTYTQTFTISVVWAYGSGGTNHTVTYNVTVTFNNEVVDATHDRLTMRSTSTASSSDINYNRKLTFSALVGDSTQSVLGNPTYIDCEIGEAYKLDGDTVIGLNKYIELGSDLPTLASGANEVTYNGAITELKVTPNWWKL